jgi:hypothetical protein
MFNKVTPEVEQFAKECQEAYEGCKIDIVVRRKFSEIKIKDVCVSDRAPILRSMAAARGYETRFLISSNTRVFRIPDKKEEVTA